MKHLFKLTFVMFLMFGALFSCGKDEDNDQKPFDKKMINGRWDISTENNTLTTIVFEENNTYVVVKKTNDPESSPQYLTGTYEITNNETLKLQGYGSIKVTYMDISNLAFIVTLDNNANKEIALNSTKVADIVASRQTNLLCKKWQIVNINGADKESLKWFVTYLKSGIYLIEGPENGARFWKWKDSEEKIIIADQGADISEITELTDTSLKMKEKTTSYEAKATN